MYDLLLKNGRVIDPAQGLTGVADVAVAAGRIVNVAANLDAQEARRVIDVSGRTVTPGLIDPHVHVYEGFTRLGVHPDVVGVQAGVTALADAGSCGPYTYHGFPVQVMPNIATDLFVFINLARVGLAVNPEIESERDVDLDAAIQAVSENPGVVKGVKARMVSPALNIMGMEMPRLALRVARETGTKAMFHIGHRAGNYSAEFIRALLPLLAPGDIITHIYCDHLGGVLDADRRLIPEAKEALARGVLMDVGFGQTHFGFDAARRIIDQGLVAHSISSDITGVGRRTTVHSFVEMMTRFLALGFSLEEVVAMGTVNAARVLGIEETHGSMTPGRRADISVLELRDGDWTVEDTEGATLKTTKAVVPVLTVKGGEVFSPEWGPRPWGWTPNPPRE